MKVYSMQHLFIIYDNISNINILLAIRETCLHGPKKT